MLAVVAMAASAATNYEINIAGVEVSSSNASYITGGDITRGYGVYNASTNTLTLYNMTIYRTGQDNYGIHNRKCDNLKIVFSGSCSIRTADNALKLERATTLNAASGSITTFYSSARICANLKSYNYYITGSGTMRFEADQSAYEAIKGNGTSSTKVYFQGAEVFVSSLQRSALSSFAAYLQSGTDLTIAGNGSNASVSSVSMSFSGNTTILEPYGAYYSSNSVYNSSGSQITSGNIYISDNYALLINSSNFPNNNFRNALLTLYPKGYLTTSQLQNLTSLNVSGKSISNLTGVDKLTYLKTLNCSSNSLTSLPSLPSSLTTLDCHSNQLISQLNVYNCSSLTTLNCSSNQLISLNLPSSLQSLNCASNRFNGTFSLTGRSNLKTLDMSNNTSLTTLSCYSNALTSLNVSGCSSLTTLYCYNNALTSLSVSGCSALTTLDCSSNSLTSLPTLPSSLRWLSCASNKFSGTFSLTGRSNLKTLDVSSNPSLTTLNCYSNALTTLNVSGCSALTTLDCHSNQLTSLGTLPSSLQSVNCSSNKFSGTFTLTGRSNLKTLNISNNPSLTTLNCNNNALTSLTTDGCSSLTTLDCSNNQLTSPGAIHASLQNINCSNNRLSGTSSLTDHSNLKTLNISSNPSLTALYCQNNALTSLNVQNCSAMTTLQCHKNQLTSLNLTGCSALTSLSCNNNQLTSLTNLPMSLQSLYCGSNNFSGTFSLTSRSNLKTLDVSSNSYITTLNCYSNSLTTLNVSGCSALTTLNCGFNQLTSLDVSSLSNLTVLQCYYNKLTSLNVANKTKLTNVEAVNNQLTSLNVSGCTALQRLVCGQNKLSSLSVEGCNALRELNCYGNQIKESGMNTLVNSLCTIPAGSSGDFLVLYPGLSSEGYTEGNVITNAQVSIARNKRWMPKKWNGDNWVDIPVNTIVPGDVNGDGTVTSADVTALYNYLLNSDDSAIVNGDQSGDGEITAADVTIVYTIMLAGKK